MKQVRRTCECYPPQTFPKDDVYDVTIVDDDGRFICTRCTHPIPPSTVGRLQRFEASLERIGHPDGAGTFHDGSVTVVQQVETLGPGHADAGKVIGHTRTCFWNRRPVRLV